MTPNDSEPDLFRIRIPNDTYVSDTIPVLVDKPYPVVNVQHSAEIAKEISIGISERISIGNNVCKFV